MCIRDSVWPVRRFLPQRPYRVDWNDRALQRPVHDVGMNLLFDLEAGDTGSTGVVAPLFAVEGGRQGPCDGPLAHRDGAMKDQGVMETAIGERSAQHPQARVVTCDVRESRDHRTRQASLRQRAVSYTHLRAHETPEHLVC